MLRYCPIRFAAGYHLGQWRIPAHKELAYETDLRVPFIVRGPGVRQNAATQAIGLNVDVAVTLADFGRPELRVPVVICHTIRLDLTQQSRNLIERVVQFDHCMLSVLSLTGHYTPPKEAMVDGLSLKMLLLSGTDDGEASWPRTQFLFEHEGGDIKPFVGANADHCKLSWLKPDGGAPSNPTVPGTCICFAPSPSSAARTRNCCQFSSVDERNNTSNA